MIEEDGHPQRPVRGFRTPNPASQGRAFLGAPSVSPQKPSSWNVSGKIRTHVRVDHPQKESYEGFLSITLCRDTPNHPYLVVGCEKSTLRFVPVYGNLHINHPWTLIQQSWTSMDGASRRDPDFRFIFVFGQWGPVSRVG